MSFLRSQDPLDYRKSKIIPEKKSTSASLTMWMPWLHGTQQTGKFFKRWEYQTTLLASWEICTQVRKQQLEPDIEQQTGPNWERSTKGRIASPCYLTYIPSSVQSLSHVQFFVTPWTAACQASMSITNSRSLLKLMSIKSVMSSSHLILCHLLLLPPSIFSSIRVFSNESVISIRWPYYWSFSFSISPSNEYSGLISFRGDWLDLLAVQETLKCLPGICRVHHVEHQTGWSASWNQDCQEKSQ